ncbi:MAG TPA: DUF4384 domain-containing protein [Pyrinomonadaceae bacterium]|jgi:hypothetical protein
MRIKHHSFYLAATLAGALLAPGIIGPVSALAQESSTTWDKPQQVERKAKPRRQYRPRPKVAVRPKVERAPLLTVQYRLLKLRENGTATEINPATTVHAGDMLRLGVTANQDGFLYIVHQKEGQDGVILFPSSRVNDGQNFVARNREFVLPSSFCDNGNLNNCWYKVTNDPGKDFFIVIFSRDLILDLPNQAATTLSAGGIVKKEIIDEYMSNVKASDYILTSRPRNFKSNTPGGPYSVWVTNRNPKDNEEIILRVPLSKAE